MDRPDGNVQTLTTRSRVLWSLVILMVAAFALAVPLLFLPLLSDGGGGAAFSERKNQLYYALSGLAAAVAILCFVTLVRQRSLQHLRDTIEAQERERDLIRSRLNELTALFQVSTSLNLQLRLDLILELIVRRVVSTLRAQQASVMLLNPETGILETRASYGLESEFAKNAKARLGEGIAGWVAERREPLILQGSRDSNPHGAHYKTDRNITSALSLPLRVGERVIGVLNVNRIHHPEPFQVHHRDVLGLFAEHVGAVIERAEAIERMSSRARELEADNLRLAEANQLKDVFLSTASHELKTPLASVIAYAELLEENESELQPAQREEFVKRLKGEASRLMRLIEDLLELSRLESGKIVLHRRELALNEIVTTALETLKPQAARQHVTLVTQLASDLPRLSLDEVKMRQVVVNLVGNAIKFSPIRSEVTVRTHVEPRWVVIEVRDQGPGILPEETAHVFELFGHRSKGLRGEEGLGIGLHLVKRISELHGAHVGVKSEPGRGSTFWVRLPLAEDAALPNAA